MCCFLIIPVQPRVDDGVAQAARSIDNGNARAVLDKMVDITNLGASGTVSNGVIAGTALDDVDAS